MDWEQNGNWWSISFQKNIDDIREMCVKFSLGNQSFNIYNHGQM